MRLYLSSYRLADDRQAFVDLVPNGGHAAVIANAGDGWGPAKRPEQVAREIADLAGLGVTAEDLDLREWFGRADALREHLDRFNVVWVKGGNTFVLRRAFHLSGFDEILLDRLRDDSIAYAGYSAGTCVMTPSLHGIEPMDEPDTQPDGYSGAVLWDALGVVPYQIIPHYRSDHPESPLADTCIEQLIAAHRPFIALRDGEALIVHGNESRVTSRLEN